MPRRATDPPASTPAPRRRGRPPSDIDTAEVVRLRDQEGLSWNGIATGLGKPRATVREVYRRAKGTGQFLPKAKNQERPSAPRPESPFTAAQTANKRAAVPAQDNVVGIHIAGFGAGRDGSDGGFVCVFERSRKRLFETIFGVSRTEATWRGVLRVLGQLRPGARAELIVDQPLIWAQWEERIRDGYVSIYLNRAREIIRKRELDVALYWLRPSMNLAVKRLKRLQRQQAMINGSHTAEENQRR